MERAKIVCDHLAWETFVMGAGLCIVHLVCSKPVEYCTGIWQTLSRKRMQRRGSTMLPGTTSWTSWSCGWMLVADLVALQRLEPNDVFHVLFVTTLMD